MITLNWLQSGIYALPKGFFLAHFVRLLPVSSGLDPKPIKSTGGFQFNLKGFESGHLLCLQQKFAEHNRDHRNLPVGLNQVREGGWMCFGFFFQSTRLFVGDRGPVFLYDTSLFLAVRAQVQHLAACAVKRQPGAWACGCAVPWRTWWHIIPTYSLSAAPAASAHHWQAWAVSMVTRVPSRCCLWPCHLLLLHLSSVRNCSMGPSFAAQNASVKDRQARARNNIIIKHENGFKEKEKENQHLDCGFSWRKRREMPGWACTQFCLHHCWGVMSNAGEQRGGCGGASVLRARPCPGKEQ